MRLAPSLGIDLCLITAGTALGALVRWSASALHTTTSATVAVNLIGAVILGFLIGRYPSPHRFQSCFWRKGVLAGFTTYSGIHLVTLGPFVSTAAIALHIACGLFAALAGLFLGRWVQRQDLERG